MRQTSHNESPLSALSSLKVDLSSDEFRVFERHRTSFNMFKALKISDFEVRHSNMLAWLMDPREKHGLNGRFLKDLVAKIQMSNPGRYDCLAWLGDKDFSSCIVLREEDYRDIQVEFPAAKVVLVIENKWNAGEAEGGANDGGQLQRYSKAVDSQFGGDWQKVFVFLTPEEILPSLKNKQTWGVLGYGAIRDALAGLLKEYPTAGNPTVKDFIEHYKMVVEERVGRMDSEEERLCEEIYAKHHEALRIVMKHHDAIKDRLVAKLKKGIPEKNRKGRLTCSHDRRDLWIQYNSRFPETKTDSFHYEIAIPKDDDCFRLYVHVENGTDKTILESLRKDIRDKAKKVSGMTVCTNGAKGKDVPWVNRSFDEVYSEICRGMERLYDTFEPIVAKYEMPGDKTPNRS